MQFLNDVKQKGAQFLEENASTLLTAGGVVGTIATGVLAGRGGLKAGAIIREAEAEIRVDRSDDNAELPVTEKVKLAWPYFVPPVVTGGFTIGAIIFAHRLSAQKIGALVAAYGLADRRLEEYKEKVSEKLTGPKKDQIDVDIAQDRVNNTPGSDQIVIIEGSGDVLCFDEPTGRYFKSTPEKIRRAENATNAEILRHNGASASYFYDELELPPTTWSDHIGWGIGEQVKVKFNYVKDPNGDKPLLSIDFQNMPSVTWKDGY